MDLYIRHDRKEEAELDEIYGENHDSIVLSARSWLAQNGLAFTGASSLALFPASKIIESIKLAEEGDQRCIEVAMQVRDEICEKFCNAIRHRYEISYQEKTR